MNDSKMFAIVVAFVVLWIINIFIGGNDVE